MRTLTHAQDGLDTLRTLTQAQDGLSISDISNFFRDYQGSLERVEFILSQDTIKYEIDCSNEACFPPLATALRSYIGLPSEISLIQNLIRRGVDLHAPVRYLAVDSYSTPLDELFSTTTTPYEARVKADDWLQILSSEGYDVLAYLQEERHLHIIQEHSINPNWNLGLADTPRRLVFELKNKPSVHWEWWIDPESPAFLLFEEFKQLNSTSPCSIRVWFSWEERWPFEYPAWSKRQSSMPWREWKRVKQSLRQRAQERANRRLEKTARKLAQAQGIKWRSHIPGAWPV